MCKDVTPEPERRWGRLYELCDRFAECLVSDLPIPPGGPAVPLFEAYGCASVAVVEYGYFDLDYRSEFSITHETSFRTRDPSTVRVHFFAKPAHGVAHLRDVAASGSTYYGYVVVRPQVPGTIGRSIVTTDGACDDLRDNASLRHHVRIAVSEQVDLFGVPLVATGVPYMEQDGALLTCAHVSAWICHYSGVLRGTVPRRSTGQFHLAEDETGSWGRYGRQYPSGGLAPITISQILRRLDLPPEVVEPDELLRDRPLEWYDRAELKDLVATSPDDDHQERQPQAHEQAEGDDTADVADNDFTDLERAWVAENLTATICRYLNSGVPVILARADQQHTQVVVGYLRHEDLATDQDDTATLHSDVVTLLVHDDQAGPYRRVPVSELVQEILTSDQILASLIVPLPKGLWLSGTMAERGGGALLANAVAHRRTQSPAADEAARDLLDEVHAGMQTGAGTLAIRSYAITGSDFKQSFADRFDDPAAVRLVGQTRLPKYVWVVEAISRARRNERADAVVATVVLDGSKVEGDLGAIPGLVPLVIHIPGQVYSADLNEHGQAPYDDSLWTAVVPKPYRTGRWHHDEVPLNSAARVAARAKGALSGR